MSRLLITTVGTSLLTNPGARPWVSWIRNAALPDVAIVDAWLDSAEPCDACAELNTLHRIDICADDRVRFLHSDTSEGEFCSARLAKWAKTRCQDVKSIAIMGLNYQHHSFGRAGAGLKNLIRHSVDLVRDANNGTLVPIFCATGGFKAEIAFLNLLGALLEVEVVYIHEQFKELVWLPRLPLSWNIDFVRANQAFFEWIDAEPRSSIEVEHRLRANPDLRSLVVHGDDGNAYLDAAGDLMWQAAKQQLATAPRALWPPADPRPPAQKNGLSGVEHHRPRGWEAFMNRLCAIDCVSRVTYDPIAHGGSLRVKILDTMNGDIGITFGATDTLPLRVETTAKGNAQTELVAEYLRRLK